MKILFYLLAKRKNNCLLLPEESKLRYHIFARGFLDPDFGYRLKNGGCGWCEEDILSEREKKLKDITKCKDIKNIKT